MNLEEAGVGWNPSAEDTNKTDKRAQTHPFWSFCNHVTFYYKLHRKSSVVFFPQWELLFITKVAKIISKCSPRATEGTKRLKHCLGGCQEFGERWDKLWHPFLVPRKRVLLRPSSSPFPMASFPGRQAEELRVWKGHSEDGKFGPKGPSFQMYSQHWEQKLGKTAWPALPVVLDYRRRG